MNVPTIKIDEAEAQVKLDAINAAIADGKDPTPADESVRRAYRYAAKGLTLIDVHAVFRACPLDEKGRPKLAIGRGHWTHCFYRPRSGSNGVTFAQTDRNTWIGSAANSARRINLPRSVFPAGLKEWQDSRAIVPVVPIEHRPDSKLSNFHVLWEAVWEDVPPVDPYLLRHIEGPLYAVLAEWDLTEIERAVLAARIGGAQS